ncbi:MAG: PilZ domain-containing protein [Candidatus Aminicenantes bacterium]|nr:PilZ domain-containing protein [Candidatus Aminicenantes bacterium]
MKPNNRAEERIPSILTINLKYNDRIFSGMTQNISKNGIYIEAIEMNSSKNRELSIMVAAEKSLFQLKGEIIWTQPLSCKSSEKSLTGIGIKLSEVSPGYLNYVEYLKYRNRNNH